MSSIQAIIFDFDGTIIDTEGPDYESWNAIFAQHGVELPLETWVQYVGGGEIDFDPYDFLEAQVGRAIVRPVVRQQRREDMRRRVAQEPLRPGVLPLIEYARAHGLKLAVASSSPASWVRPHLNERGLDGYFSVIRTRDDVERVKPDPALFRTAAEQLGVDVQNTLAIEDSEHGVTSAKRAGMHCVAVPHAVTRNLDFSAADLCLDSLAAHTPAALLAALASPRSVDR